MTDISELDTPCVLVDLDRVEANLQRAQAFADESGLKLRPHIKTHKLPRFAQRAINFGAVGITVQKLGEAEVMADAGITDMLLTFNIIGAAKLKRLRALSDRVTIRVVADSAECVAGLSEAFADSANPLGVLVECDTGMGRCGVQSPEAALELAKIIIAAPGLEFFGLMTYPAAGKYHEAAAWLAAAKSLFDAEGIAVPIITTGGTPDIWHADEAGVATEYRPGTYIYMDRSQVAAGSASYDDCALTVLATVVSHPTTGRAIIDAGSKALTSDLLGLVGHGYIPAYPDAKVVGLSEEHGTLDVSACAEGGPKIGEQIVIIPNHCCPVTNLFDHVHLVRDGQLVETVAVAARGRVD
ncbi:D-serine deaminase, pyridoxal phosphate-dependent [Devosia sp. YR412]|uniref:D-TA family PLP-dependent enzyme n=1 Tax=Devosia sp. YR412 TaxID=1881030 RepID=UPI0008B8B023|nr:D-TA family PLP-dependent enzyme [Devosia sp. YR412]SEP69043.1 D-serine deaminase, pyridoxal phosphate-dependent [Devosia sp. YR412]